MSKMSGGASRPYASKSSPISRRAVITGLAALPAAVVTTVAKADDDAQARYQHHFEGLKQAIRDLSPTTVYFSKDLDDTGLLSSLIVIPAVITK